MVDTVEDALVKKMSIKADKTHGKMTQSEREMSMYAVKYGYAEVLIATIGLCGRGVNISDVTHLIMWKMPTRLSEYKFCLGRVGRIGNEAKAMIFYDDSDIGRGVSGNLISFLQSNQQDVPEDMTELLASGTANFASDTHEANNDQGSWEVVKPVKEDGKSGEVTVPCSDWWS